VHGNRLVPFHHPNLDTAALHRLIDKPHTISESTDSPQRI
jgi:hypothetical protein